MRPSRYNPAHRSTPQWWRHSTLWKDGQRYGLWPIAKAYWKRAKKRTGLKE